MFRGWLACGFSMAMVAVLQPVARLIAWGLPHDPTAPPPYNRLYVPVDLPQAEVDRLRERAGADCVVVRCWTPPA